MGGHPPGDYAYIRPPAAYRGEQMDARHGCRERAVEVLILETKTGRLAAKIAIVVGRNCLVSKQECFGRAWKVAVAVKSIDPTRRNDYSFKFA
jgi:hypothetical protein